MSSVIKRFLSDTAIYGFTTIISRLVNFVLTPILVHRFETAVYGVFTYMYSWAALINTFLAFGMETTFFRYLQKVEENDKPKVFNNTFIVTVFTSVAFLMLLLFFAQPIANWFATQGGQSIQDYKSYVYFMGGILVADALAVVPFAKLRSQNRPIRYSFVKMTNVAVVVGLTLFFIVFLPWLLKVFPEWRDTFSWYRGQWVGYVFLSNLIASIVTLLMLIPEMRGFVFKTDKKLLSTMFSYSFPIFVANVSFIINEHIDKILMPSLLPEEIGQRDVGIYAAVAKIAIFLSLFVQSFRLGAEPFFFSYAKNSNARQVYATIMEYFVIVMVLVMVGISMNIEWLKYFIRNDDVVERAKYWSGLDYVPIILFNYVLLGIYMNLSVWYKLSDQTKYGLYISGIGAVITVILCYVFIPQLSYVGAIMVTTITYVTMISLSYFWGQKNYAIPYPVGKMMMHMVVGAALIGLNYLCFERNFWTGNGLLLLYMLFILYTERGFIKKLLKR